MKTPKFIAEVIHFEHCEKGERPDVFKGARREGPGVPGDSLFGEIRVGGIKFAISCVSCGAEGVEPGQFELALRAMVAALAKSVGAEQDTDVHVVEGEIH